MSVRDRAGRFALVVMLALAFHPTASGQTASSSDSQSATAFTITAGALLHVSVSGRPDLTNTYRVEPDGTLLLPQVGSVSVNGLSLRAAADQLASRIASSSSRRPKVRVGFDKSLQSVFVAGEVRLPGLISMRGPLSLMKALARAGSPTVAASGRIVVIHDEFPETPGSPVHEMRTEIDVKDLRTGHDVLLHDGDTVYVPKAQTFYILGEVRHPGVYVLEPGLTIEQAIALAGGLTGRGSDRRIKLLRFEDGKAVELDVDPGRVIQPDDTIRVRARLF